MSRPFLWVAVVLLCFVLLILAVGQWLAREHRLEAEHRDRDEANDDHEELSR